MSFPTKNGKLALPQTISARRRPVNLQPHDSHLFEHEFEKTLPQTGITELTKVRISAEGFLFRGFNLLTISFAFPELRDEWRLRSRIKFFLQNYLLRKPRRFSTKALWIVDDWSYGYFHWIADALTRLYVVRDQLSDSVLLLPNRYRALGFVPDSLAAFRVSKVEFIEPNEVMTVDTLTVPLPTAPSGHYREEIIRGVRELLLAEHGSHAERENAKRTYISRGRSAKRRISNEDQVVSILSEYGFTTIYAEDHSFAEQVKIASQSQFLVSNHGAGLTNMVFMRERGSVLELRHVNDNVNNCYFTLASALGLSYFYQNCQPVDSSEDPHSADLVVDVDLLRRNLELMLGGPQPS